MNTFDHFINVAKEMADTAAQKTGEVLEASKQKLQEVKLTNTINKVYCELGFLYYNSLKFGGNQEQMNASVALLDKLLKEQEELKNNPINFSREMKRSCAACGYENSANASFCAKCGNYLSDSAAEKTE